MKWDVDFADVLIKGRSSRGNVVTKYTVKRIELKEKGLSTLKPRKIWFDDVVQRLNVDERGELLGEFRAEDLLLIANQRGFIKTIPPDLNVRFDSDMIVLEKWKPQKPISVIYYEGGKERYYVKRFLIENPGREELVISEHPKSQLELISTDWKPVIALEYTKQKGKQTKPDESIDLEQFITIKGIKALGNQLTSLKVKNINRLDPLPYEEPEEQPAIEIEVVDEESVDTANDTNDITNPKDSDTGQASLF